MATDEGKSSERLGTEAPAPTGNISADLAEVAFSVMGRLANLFPRWVHENIRDDWGLAGPKLMIIGLLSRVGEMTMGEVAIALDLTPGAVTRIVKDVESLGLVTRVNDPSDRRQTRISLTASAREKERLLHPLYENLVKPLFSGLSDADMHAFIRVALKLSEALRESRVNRID